MPLLRSLANLKRGISEKKWVEARRWAGGRASRKKYKMPESHKPDGTTAWSTKRLTSRQYQLKTGHARTRAVPALGQGSSHCPVLVVPVPLTN